MIMNKVLFVVASFIDASGAEMALIDYLSSSTDDNYVLLIGTNADNRNIFLRALPPDHLYFWKYEEYRDCALTRFVFMALEGARVKKHYQKDAASDWVEKQKFDCVYLNNTLENALFGRMFEGYPVISHIHDMVRHLRPAWGYCGALGSRKAEMVITPSKAAKEELCSYGVPKEKVHVVYNGLSFPNRKFHCSYDRGTLTLGFVGGAIVRKGFDFLIKYLNLLQKRGLKEYGIDKIRLIIATNTPENDYFKKNIKELNREISLEIYRNLDHAVLSEKYNEMDILLVPSRNDPAPLVVAEGISMGCCVLGSRCDGIPEMLDSEELIFEKDNLESCYSALLGWLKKQRREQEQIIEACQTFVVKRFNSEIKKNTIQNMIEQAVVRHNMQMGGNAFEPDS